MRLDRLFQVKTRGKKRSFFLDAKIIQLIEAGEGSLVQEEMKLTGSTFPPCNKALINQLEAPSQESNWDRRLLTSSFTKKQNDLMETNNTCN